MILAKILSVILIVLLNLSTFTGDTMSKLLALLGVISLVGFNGLAAEKVKEDDNKKDHTEHADKKTEHKNKTATKKAAKHKNADHKEAKKDSKPATFNELDKDAVNAKLGKAVIIDARKVEKDGDIIKGAIVIPADADDKEITKLLKDKDAEIIVYCGNAKCPASSTLGLRLIEMGYNVSHYAGGIDEWKENEMPTDKYQG